MALAGEEADARQSAHKRSRRTRHRPLPSPATGAAPAAKLPLLVDLLGKARSHRAATGSSTAHGMAVHHERNATATASMAPMLALTTVAAAAKTVVAACSRPSGSRRRRIARGGSSSTITAGRAQN